MKDRDNEQNQKVTLIQKFTLIEALKELIHSNYPDANNPVCKTYLKVLDKKTKNPDDIFKTLEETINQLQAGKSRHKFHLIEVKKDSPDYKMIGYIRDILKILNDKTQGVDPALDAAISMKGTLADARLMAEGMAEIRAKQRTNT